MLDGMKTILGGLVAVAMAACSSGGSELGEASTDAGACAPDAAGFAPDPECLDTSGAPVANGTPCSCGACSVGRCR